MTEKEFFAVCKQYVMEQALLREGKKVHIPDSEYRFLLLSVEEGELDCSISSIVVDPKLTVPTTINEVTPGQGSLMSLSAILHDMTEEAIQQIAFQQMSSNPEAGTDAQRAAFAEALQDMGPSESEDVH